MIDTDKYEDAKKMVQDAELIDENDGHPDIHYRKIAHLLTEVLRLREALYKCWKDSGQSLYYLQVELLNDQEHWYQEMMCEDGSCEDCECGEKVIE